MVCWLGMREFPMSQGPAPPSFAAWTKCVVAIGENAGICGVSVVSPESYVIDRGWND